MRFYGMGTLPICPNMIGGILLFSEALTEDEELLYESSDNLPVAYASNNVNSTANLARGWRSHSELSKETGLATTTLTSMLDRMEAANLIYRDRGDKDRRKILIFLTEEAKGLEQEYNEVTEEISNIYYKGFSEEEIEQLE